MLFAMESERAEDARDLRGRTAIVTGSSRGIGKAIALELAKHGANVVVAARTTEPKPPWALGTIHETAAQIVAAGGRALAFELDVRDADRVEAMVAATIDEFGTIDFLVNNAGAFKQKPVQSISPRELRLILDVNVNGAFACIKSCVPHLRKSNAAHILNLSPPLRAEPYWISGKLSHAVSKMALTVMTIGLAEELRSVHIAVNSIWPKSIIATAGIERLGGDALLTMARKPEIVAEAVVLALASRQTGQCLFDEELLRDAGVTDFARFAVEPGAPLLANYFVDSSIE